MSTSYRAQYEQHRVFTLLRECETELEKTLSAKSPETANTLDRTQAIIEELGNRLNIANPFLVSTNSLNNLQSWLNEILGHLRNFNSNKSTAHLNQIPSYLDNIASQLASFPSTAKAGLIEGLADSIRKARKDVNDQARDYGKEVTEARDTAAAARKDLAEVKKRIDQETERTKSFLAGAQSQFEADLRRHSEERSKLLRELQQQFTEVRDDERKTLQAFLDEQRKLAHDSEKARQQLHLESRGQLAQRLKETNEFLTAEKKKVEELVHATAGASITAEFQLSSKTAAESAKPWRRLATVMLFLLVIAEGSIIGYQLYANKSFSWQESASRLSITVPFLLLAGYAATQAHRYHKIEDENRRIGAELSAVTPYLANIPDEARHQLLTQLAPKYFHGVREPSKEKSPIPSVASAMQSLTGKG